MGITWTTKQASSIRRVSKETHPIDLILDEGVIVIRCLSENVCISAIQPLPGGGTRLVCKTDEGAALIRRELERYVIGDGSEQTGRLTLQSVRSTGVRRAVLLPPIFGSTIRK